MFKAHEFYYTPILYKKECRYIIELPHNVEPVIFHTMTTGMKCVEGEILSFDNDHAYILTRQNVLRARMAHSLSIGHPCWVMEHLTIQGNLELLATNDNIMSGNLNFINFGIPMGKHLRIDIYTGEWAIKDG